MFQDRGCAAGYDPGSPGKKVKGEVVEAEDEDPALCAWEGFLFHFRFHLGWCEVSWGKGGRSETARGERKGCYLVGSFRVALVGRAVAGLQWGEPGCMKWGLLPSRSSLFLWFVFIRDLFNPRADPGVLSQLLLG